MNSPLPKETGKPEKVMTTEQFDRVVEAILAGKYSWACVLILRFAGYNPLQYVPYRTYNRLIKDNCCAGTNDNPSDNKESAPVADDNRVKLKSSDRSRRTNVPYYLN
jgi:hypothetical protein